MFLTRLYYVLKPFVPWSVRMGVRRWFAVRKRKRVGSTWPILPGAERPPDGWPGWPNGKKFAFVLTHDVEGPEGLAKVKQLAELEMSLGFRSCFNFIPEGTYAVPPELRAWLVENGFEVGVHDLHHDGKLFSSREVFAANAPKINHYLKDWNAVGYRSGFMLRNQEWMRELNVAYDATSFDTDPFEHQPDGAGTIFPFFIPRPVQNPTLNLNPNPSLGLNPTPAPRPAPPSVAPSLDVGRSMLDVGCSPAGSSPEESRSPLSAVEISALDKPLPSDSGSPSNFELRTSDSHPASASPSPSAAQFQLSAFEISALRQSNMPRSGYVELPYTLPQDSTLFLVFREKTPEIWLRKLDWVAQHGGMALVNVHPDYIRFPGESERPNTYPIEFYRQLLDHVRTHYLAAPPSVPAPSNFDLQSTISHAEGVPSAPSVARSLDVGCSPAGSRPEESRSPNPTLNPNLHLNPNSNLPAPSSQASPLSAFAVSAFEKSPPPSAAPSLDVGCSPAGCSPEKLPSSTPLASAAWLALPRAVAAFVRALPAPPVNRHPLRVCMVTHSHYRSDNRVIRYAEALASRGDAVDVLSLRSHSEQPRHETSQGVNVFCLQDRFGKNESGPTDHLLRTFRFLLVCSSWITRSHWQQPYDVFHIHNIPDFMVFAAVYPRLRGAKVILDIHDIVPEFFSSKFAEKRRPFADAALRLMEKWSARFAHQVIIANDLWRDKYGARTGASGRCTVFINNVDRDVFSPALRRRETRQGSTGGSPVASGGSPDASSAQHLSGVFPLIIFPGGLQWHQGVDIAIRAMPRILQSFPKAEFHIYGDGNMKPAWVALAAELALGNHVRFFPALPLREVVLHMAQADLGVVPKRADSFGNEAYSTKIMEFMALGVPVVASSTKVDRFYFDDSVLKFFESGNVEALATAIIEVLTNPEATAQRVRRASEYAAEHSWETRKQDYLKLVDDLCASR